MYFPILLNSEASKIIAVKTQKEVMKKVGQLKKAMQQFKAKAEALEAEVQQLKMDKNK